MLPIFKALHVLLKLYLGTVACFCSSTLFAKASLAQVKSDNTVDTQVNQNGNVAEITGGETRGGNLFHSFQDFSVPTDNEAFFNNADNISNIFSRVTGGNISNIDGAIRVNGSASLFLINPAGIIFGNNARLDIGGSFYGSTASSILFEEVEFSAVENLEQPILTVNAPIGLGFRDNPGDIVNRSFAQNSANDFVGLEVSSGNNLAFVGGNLNFEAGEATASGGNIYLGGLAEAGTVGLEENGSVSFPQDATLANITLTNGADIDARGTGGGNISVDAKNLTLEAGEFGSSFIRGGISSESTNPEAQAGNIAIDVAENIILNEGTVSNQVASIGIGNSGNIIINTGSLELLNGGKVDASIFGTGNAGAVNVTVTGDMNISGEDTSSFPSGITSGVNPNAEGNSGGITISTTNLNLVDGGRIDSSTFGTGNAGAVDVTATGDINISGETSDDFQSGIGSVVNFAAEGDSGGITISTTNLNLVDGSNVAASTLGTGNAGMVSVTATGDINISGEDLEGVPGGITSLVNPDAQGDAGGVTISTTNLNLVDGGRVAADTFGTGNAGMVSVTATGDINISGETSGNFSSGIGSTVNSNAEGDSGGITISTTNLNLVDGGQIAADTFGTGNAGLVNVTATGDMNISGKTSDGFSSGITSLVNLDAQGDAGGITISTTNLNLVDGGRVGADTGGSGNASNIAIDANESIFINGSIERFRSGISANALNQNGNGGDVFITTRNLTIANGGTIEATNFDNIRENNPGTGQPGSIDITANSIELNNSGRIEAATQFVGNESGIINLRISEDITLRNNSFISAEARNEANGGNLNIDTNFIVAFPDGDNDIIASADRGQGGNINIDAQALFGIEERPLSEATNDINASSEFSLDGTIAISTPGINPVQGAAQLSTNIVVPEETSQQACQADRETAANNGLNITGKGGILPAPELPLNSLNVIVNGKDNSASTTPAPVETAKGRVRPARGAKISEAGEIVLTAYRTNNAGERLMEIKRNCGI